MLRNIRNNGEIWLEPVTVSVLQIKSENVDGSDHAQHEKDKGGHDRAAVPVAAGHVVRMVEEHVAAVHEGLDALAMVLRPLLLLRLEVTHAPPDMRNKRWITNKINFLIRINSIGKNNFKMFT